MKPGRNDPCHCGSGQKYKKCCLPKDEAARLAEAAAAPPEPPEAPTEDGGGDETPERTPRPAPPHITSRQPVAGPKSHARRKV